MKKKKILSILLAAIMIVSLLPVTALAAEPTEMTIGQVGFRDYGTDFYFKLIEKDTNNIVYFDIYYTGSFEFGKTYTLNDMDPNNSYMYVDPDSFKFTACTFTATSDQSGNITSIDASVTTEGGDSYHITYPAPAPTPTGEWFSYCGEDSQFYSAIGVGGGSSIMWAIRIPADKLPQQDMLSKVSYYAYDSTNSAGNYYIAVYSVEPGTTPYGPTPDYLQLFTLSAPVSVGWNDIDLTTPYEIDNTKDLWICIENTGVSYPATYSDEILDTTDCCMMYYEGQWYSIDQLGSFNIQPWMIRGYFESASAEEELTEQELTVFGDNATQTQKFAPVYTYYGDTKGSAAQYIIPASMLTELVGKQITELKYYINPAQNYLPQSLTTPTYKGYMGVASSETLSGFIDFTTATKVFEGKLSALSGENSDELVITLDTPYTYTGGNLAIAFECTKAGNYCSTYYYSEELTGGSIYRNSSAANPNSQNYVPKTTITYLGTGGGTGKTLPYSFDFETDFIEAGWTNIDADGDGHRWNWQDETGNHSVESASWTSETGGLTPDNWLISPKISIPADGAKISWDAKSGSTSFREHYGVYLCNKAEAPSDGDDLAANYIRIYDGATPNSRSYEKLSIEIPEECWGKDYYIAFRHYESEDRWDFNIDNFAVEAKSVSHTHSFTYTVNNGNLTATCTAGCDKGYDTTPLTLTLTAPASLVYDGNVKAFTFADGEADAWTGAGLELPTVTYTKWNGTSYALYEGEPTEVGDYFAHVYAGGDGANAFVMFSISKASLTATASSHTVTYGDSVPTYTVTYTGWAKDAETPTTAPELECAYTTTSDVGEYAVTFKTAPVFANYTVKTENGKVTVNRAKTAVEPTVATGLKYTAEEQNGYTNAGTFVTLDGGKSAKNAGDYSFTATPDKNHAWSDGTTDAKTYNWSIAKAELIITASNVTAKSPETAKFDYKVSGFIGNDKLKTEPAFAVIGGIIYPNGADAGSNYFITYKTGFFTQIVLPQIIPTKPTEPVVEPDEPIVEPDEPVVEPDEIVEYTDVEAGAWYEEYVDYVTEKGYMNGIGDGKFGIDNKMTRAMFITTLWRIDGEKIVNFAMSFDDVISDEWYTEAVRWGASEEIVKGYGDENYGIDDPITREQLITILYRYAEKLGLDVSVDENTNFLSFDDVFEISEYARPAMFWALENGIINGTSESTLSPKNDATRVQVAAIFERFCELLETVSVSETEAE